MRSSVPERTGGLPALIVEDSPDAADLALLEEQVAAAAIAAAGLGDEREFGIFGRDDGGRVVAGISPPRLGGFWGWGAWGGRRTPGPPGAGPPPSPPGGGRGPAAEAARSSCFTPTTC